MNESKTEIEVTNETPSPADNQTLVAEATQDLTQQVAILNQEVETLKGQLAEANAAHSELVEELEGAKAAYAYAVEDYKKLVLQSNPLFTADIICGTTIDELKASMEKASLFASKVKAGLEAQAQAQAAASVVPAGAPARTGPDLASLSTKEKINYGLEQAKRRKD